MLPFQTVFDGKTKIAFFESHFIDTKYSEFEITSAYYSYITYITSFFFQKKAGANKSWGGAPLLTTLPGSLLLNLSDTKTRNFLKCENRDKA